jgi:hypothetical protein
MTKYLLGLAALIALVLGYLALAPDPTAPVAPPAAPEAPAAAPEPPAAQAPAAPPAPAAAPAPAPAPLGEDESLEQIAAAARESLPATVSDSLTLADVVFLPRMRIMEYRYVTTAGDARDLQARLRSQTEAVCTEGRAMFDLGVTLRNSFEDPEGRHLGRSYLLAEDCAPFD